MVEDTQIDVFQGFGAPVHLVEHFSMVREALTRIGIANYRTKNLVQTCHLFHKRGEYAIMHFKEMFRFDGKEADLTEEDVDRRNQITSLLETWGLVKPISPVSLPAEPTSIINIIPRKFIIEDGWELTSKYTLGKQNSGPLVSN